MMTPVVVTWLSTSLSGLRTPSSRNSRLPPPTTTGSIITRNSSTRSCSTPRSCDVVSAVQAVEAPEGVVDGQDLEPGEAHRSGPAGHDGGAQDRAGHLHGMFGEGGGQAVQDAPAVHEPLGRVAGGSEGVGHAFV